jgi:hypothetical protein
MKMKKIWALLVVVFMLAGVALVAAACDTEPTQHTVTITAPASGVTLTVMNGAEAVTSGTKVDANTVLTITFGTTLSGHTAELRINGSAAAGATSPYSHTVTGNVTIAVVAIPPAQSTITIVQRHGVESLTVMNGATAVTSGTALVNGTVLTVDWTMKDGYEGELHINGAKVAEEGPYNHTVNGAATIEVVYTDAPYTEITDAAGLAAMTMDGTYKLAANLELTDWSAVGTPAAPFTGELFARRLSALTKERLKISLSKNSISTLR